jgi:hypothetical protein
MLEHKSTSMAASTTAQFQAIDFLITYGEEVRKVTAHETSKLYP